MTAADAVPAGTTFVAGSVTGATGIPPTLSLVAPLAPNTAVTVTFQVKVGNGVPEPNPIVNMADTAYTYTVDPANPDGVSATAPSNPVSTLIGFAAITAVKTVDLAYANAGEVLTYTIKLQNSGNVAANAVVVKDVIPQGTTYVAGSLSGDVPFSGDPNTTIQLTTPLPAGGSATLSFQVKIGNAVPAVNPVPNSVAVAFAYTVDPAKPNGATGSAVSNTVSTLVSMAKLNISKTADKAISYIGDTIMYQIMVKNTGNVAANQVVVTDLIPLGTTFVAGSLVASVAVTGLPDTGISLTNPVAAGESVSISFKVLVSAIPVPNPIENVATAQFVYTVNPADPDGAKGSGTSNVATTLVFRHNFGQQITDLIHSVALEEAALANIANAEGAKIQAMVARGDVSTQELLCLNRSVAEMLDTMTLLEQILRQKLNAVSCQIDGTGAGC